MPRITGAKSGFRSEGRKADRAYVYAAGETDGAFVSFYVGVAAVCVPASCCPAVNMLFSEQKESV